jgi:hypothetical protein
MLWMKYLIQMLLKSLQSLHGRGKIVEVSWKEFGSPNIDFAGQFFFVGLFAGHFARLSPASFTNYPHKAPIRNWARWCRLKGQKRKKKDFWTVCQFNHDSVCRCRCYRCSTLFKYESYLFVEVFFD